MTFSISHLSDLCRDFCQEFDAIAHKADHFLAQFHTEDRVRFFDEEAIKKSHLAPYGAFLTSLLATLEKTDALGIRLSAILIGTDSPETIEYQAKIDVLWHAYEQYRACVCQYCENTQKYWTDKHTLATQGTAPLVSATRSLIAALHKANDAFLLHIE